MLIIVQIILSTLLIFAIKCELTFIEPEHKKFSSSEFDISKMFSSSSPYPGEDLLVDDSDDCIPINVWLFSRHGSKYHSTDIINGITNNLVLNIQKKLNELYGDQNGHNFSQLEHNQKQIITDIINWKNDLANATGKDLNASGVSAMKSLGERLKKKCNILTDILQTKEIEAHSATEDRCINSGKLFLKEFYKSDQSITIIKNTDARLKIHKEPKYMLKIQWDVNEEEMLPEDSFFLKHFQEISKRIKELLFPKSIGHQVIGTDEDFRDIVKSMYYVCQHGCNNCNKNEMGAYPWCQLFTFKDLQIFEAMHDVRYLYRNGYYNESNRNYGTKITKDMLDFLRDSNGIKLKLFFGHSSNMLSIITRLNLFKDVEGLTIHNILDKPNRKWKTSFIVPFGCNIMVIVYLCGNETRKASILLNEVPLLIQLDNSTCVKCPIDDVIRLIEKLLINTDNNN